MNRRGFFSNITSVFKSRHEGDPFFFGVQCVINVYGEDGLRAALHRVIAQENYSEDPHEKFEFYKRIAALLRQNIPFIDYGFWDYLTKVKDAEAEFDSWVTEIEASMATVEEELGTSIDESFRLDNDKYYVVVTISMLLEYSARQKEFIDIIESIEEDDYFSQIGFQKLIDAIPYIDFEYSYADAVFIMPGNEEDGFSWTDMRGEGWEYLKPIMGSIS